MSKQNQSRKKNKDEQKPKKPQEKLVHATELQQIEAYRCICTDGFAPLVEAMKMFAAEIK